MNIVAYAILLLNSCIVQFISIIYFISFDFIMMQLVDRIAILIKGFFLMTARRLLWNYRRSR